MHRVLRGFLLPSQMFLLLSQMDLAAAPSTQLTLMAGHAGCSLTSSVIFIQSRNGQCVLNGFRRPLKNDGLLFLTHGAFYSSMGWSKVKHYLHLPVTVWFCNKSCQFHKSRDLRESTGVSSLEAILAVNVKKKRLVSSWVSEVSCSTLS